MRYVTSTLAVLALVLVVVFSFQNRDAVDVSFMAWSMSLPKIFLMLGIYVLGMFSGWGLVELVKRAI